ncbi:MAG: ABC transporter permease, partial [Acidimicrobiia bacterium]
VVAASGVNPLVAYRALFEGALGSGTAIGRTLEKATPLVLSGLAVAFAFKAGLFNIGGQGQLILGASVAAWVGFAVELPALVHAPAALLAGGLAGAAWGAVPGILKATTGAHEVITTIMLNFVAINLTDWLADGPWKDDAVGNIVARTPPIHPSADIPSIGIVPAGFIISLAVVAATWWLLYKMPFGFEVRTVGLNPSAARYAGMRVALTVALTMAISGMLAGLGGAVETQGVVGRYQPGFSAGLGFEGITIALLGRTHPFGMIPAALLVGAMQAGTSRMQFEAGVAAEIVDVVQGLMLFFVAADVIVRRLIRARDGGEPRVQLSSGWGRA